MTATGTRPGTRNVRLLGTAELVSFLGTRAADLAMPLLVLSLTGSAAQAGLVFGLGVLARALTAVPMGVLADRLPPRTALAAVESARAVLVAAFAATVFLDVAALWLICVVTVADGTGGSLFRAAQTVAVKASVPVERLPSVLARLQFPQFAATLAGPLIGGALFAVSPALPFALDCASYAVSALCSLALTRPVGGWGPVEEAEAPLAGLRLVWRSVLLRTILLWSAAMNAALGAVNVAVVVIAGGLGAGADGVGMMMSIGGCGGLIGAACAPYLAGKLSAQLIVRVASWTVALVPLSFLLLGTTAAIGAALAVMFFALPVGNVVLGTRRIESTPAHLQGSVEGASYLVASAVAPAGPAVVGWALDAAGPPLAMPIVTLIAGSAALFTLSRSFTEHLSRRKS